MALEVLGKTCEIPSQRITSHQLEISKPIHLPENTRRRMVLREKISTRMDQGAEIMK
jgi:hypothetical protein